MKFVCISAANIEPARNTSASVRTCRLIAEQIGQEQPGAQVEIVPLIDYEMKSCRMCGECHGTHVCTRDEDFNRLFEKLCSADALFWVVPHYAPLPSKMMVITEKMEEMVFLGWCANPDYRFPLAGKPVGIVVHGGQSAPEALPYYEKALLEPLAMAFGSCQMSVVGPGAENARGVAFGITNIKKRPNSVFVDITHDWDDISRRVAPLVSRVVAAAAGSGVG
jgi:multimeric flavodoxin WrbA